MRDTTALIAVTALGERPSRCATAAAYRASRRFTQRVYAGTPAPDFCADSSARRFVRTRRGEPVLPARAPGASTGPVVGRVGAKVT
jgi:hypothetical protein